MGKVGATCWSRCDNRVNSEQDEYRHRRLLSGVNFCSTLILLVEACHSLMGIDVVLIDSQIKRRSLILQCTAYCLQCYRQC